MRIQQVTSLGFALMMGCTAPAVALQPANSFHNDEFGFSVTFPSGGKVCPSLSGDHAHGFYASYYGKPTVCGSTKFDPKASALAIYASYNSAFSKSPWEELDASCQKAKPVDLQKSLSFRGYSSVSCVMKKADGAIEVDVVAYTGNWPEAGTSTDPDFQTPRFIYMASLGTSRARFKTDMALFRVFLASIDIKTPR